MALDVSRPWGRMRVWEFGSGQTPILAIHGLAGSGRYWEGLSRALGSQFTLVAPDLSGFGASDKPRAHDYSRANHVADLEAVIERCMPTAPFTIVGHSMGGILAGLVTARGTHKVQRLAVVAAPVPHGDGLPPRFQRAREGDSHGPRAALLATMRATWPVLTFPFRSKVYPRAVVVDFLKNTRQSYWETAASVIWSGDAAVELQPLRSYSNAALLLTSDTDRTVWPESTARWAGLLPAAVRTTAPGGHQLLLRTHFEPLARWLHESRPTQRAVAERA